MIFAYFNHINKCRVKVIYNVWFLLGGFHIFDKISLTHEPKWCFKKKIFVLNFFFHKSKRRNFSLTQMIV